jgi:hypothetical protein
MEVAYEHAAANGQIYKTTVGESLAAALRCLRHSRVPLVIWVDAVCINQGDDIEKSQQVQVVYSIYEKAKQVVSWLGHSSPHTDMALDSINKIGGQVNQVLRDNGVPGATDQTDWWSLGRVWAPFFLELAKKDPKFHS